VCCMAAGGLLKHAHVTLTEPHYSRADVWRISFATVPED
jgi:hypothetical protein